MKVLALNGSPRKNGNTTAVLETLGEIFREAGMEYEILHLGAKNIRGCVACDGCLFTESHRCVMADEEFNGWLDKMEACDGLILACPTYFYNIPGTFKCFLDRAFCGHGHPTRNKVAMALTVLRRAGGSQAYAQLLHYIATCDMIQVPSRNGNIVHAALKGEAGYDTEGMEAVCGAARSMVWLLNSLQGKFDARPAGEPWNVTNFVRDDLKKSGEFVR